MTKEQFLDVCQDILRIRFCKYDNCIRMIDSDSDYVSFLASSLGETTPAEELADALNDAINGVIVDHVKKLIEEVK